MKQLEPAKLEELEEYGKIIEDARLFQQEQGFVQWTKEYPNTEIIRRDIETGKGYALKVDGQTAGYLFLDFEGDASYKEIEGEWKWDGAYAAMHRIALSRSFRGQGLSDAVFGLAQELCREQKISCIRIDTDSENLRMQHVLEKNGFVRCGTVLFEGSPKLAYEKLF